MSIFTMVQDLGRAAVNSYVTPINTNMNVSVEKVFKSTINSVNDKTVLVDVKEVIVNNKYVSMLIDATKRKEVKVIETQEDRIARIRLETSNKYR